MRFARSSRVLLALFAITLGSTACASGGGAGGVRRGSSTRITAEELDSVAELDLFAAISRLRPQWLRPGTRGQLPEVVLNGSHQPGGAEMLRNIRASDASELEYMSASDATTRYGTGFTGGAIVVTTRR